MILPDDYPPHLPPPGPPPKPARNPFVGRSVSRSSSTQNHESAQIASSSNSREISHQSDPSTSSDPDSSPTADPGHDPLNEELPPAYTPAADVSQGETTIEYGPRRPFQPVVQPPMVTQQNGWPMVSQPTGPSWSQYPGFSLRPGMIPQIPPAPPVSRSQFIRPPQHPLFTGMSNTAQYTSPPMSAPPIPSRPVSDFARDFYSAGANADMTLLGGPVSQYVPTPGPSNDGAPATQSSPSPGGPSARLENTTSHQIPNDGSPTKTPVPGHPLLRDGKILVYPQDFECKKCKVIIINEL